MYCKGPTPSKFESPSPGSLAVLENRMPDSSPDRFRTKWTQIRRDQQSSLDDLARELQDAKSHKGGERITANTVIRLGIDTVLACRDRLAGDDEQQLRQTLFEYLGVQDKGGDSASES